MSGLPLNPSPAVRRLNPELFGGGSPTEPLRGVVVAGKERKIIRVQKSAEEKLNKTEKRFLAYLRAKYPTCRIGIQDVRITLAADCRFTPDFSLWASENSPMEFYDVKGPHHWEDSLIKLKTAATLFKMFRFFIAYEDNGRWIEQEIPR